MQLYIQPTTHSGSHTLSQLHIHAAIHEAMYTFMQLHIHATIHEAIYTFMQIHSWNHLQIHHLKAALSLGVLLAHDPLLLCPLLLLAAGLGGLLPLGVGLLQEVLLHARTVPVSLLLALDAQTQTSGRTDGDDEKQPKPKTI